ncbi:hypothetical protein D3C78_1171850 [compost metagenome]
MADKAMERAGCQAKKMDCPISELVVNCSLYPCAAMVCSPPFWGVDGFAVVRAIMECPYDVISIGSVVRYIFALSKGPSCDRCFLDSFR